VAPSYPIAPNRYLESYIKREYRPPQNCLEGVKDYLYIQNFKYLKPRSKTTFTLGYLKPVPKILVYNNYLREKY